MIRMYAYFKIILYLLILLYFIIIGYIAIYRIFFNNILSFTIVYI